MWGTPWQEEPGAGRVRKGRWLDAQWWPADHQTGEHGLHAWVLGSEDGWLSLIMRENISEEAFGE